MKARLNITIDEGLLRRVKTHAQKQKKTVSQLVEDYFRTLTKTPPKKSFLQLVDELPRLSIPDDVDLTEEYYRRKGKKA